MSYLEDLLKTSRERGGGNANRRKNPLKNREIKKWTENGELFFKGAPIVYSPPYSETRK